VPGDADAVGVRGATGDAGPGDKERTRIPLGAGPTDGLAGTLFCGISVGAPAAGPEPVTGAALTGEAVPAARGALTVGGALAVGNVLAGCGALPVNGSSGSISSMDANNAGTSDESSAAGLRPAGGLSRPPEAPGADGSGAAGEDISSKDP
jgi:hypothetical protein